MSRVLASLAAAAILAAPTGVAGAQPGAPDARFTSARRVIDSLMTTLAIPSVAVAVSQGDRIVWEEGFGWSNREQRIRATPHTAYSLASISKPFTATALMRLVEEGKVRLDAPVNDYLGAGKVRAFAGDARGATVERVLTHTSGLPLHYQFYYADGGYAPPPMDETIRRYGILVHPPGDVYQYSNLGYGILDHIVARVGGPSYAEYMRRSVFDPLGLAHTSVGPRAELERETAERYFPDGTPIPYYTFDHVGASEVYSSAHDLVRFGMFHLKQRVAGSTPVLKPATIDAMQRDVATESPGFTRGLGWGIRQDEFGHRRVAHTGGMPGVATILALYPSSGVAIVVLTNASTPAAGRIAQEIAAAVLPGYAERRAAAPVTPAAPVAAGELSRALAGAWRGWIRTHADSVSVTVVVGRGDSVTFALGTANAERVRGASWRNGVFEGRTAARLTPSDIARHPHELQLLLRARGDTLSGWGAAMNPSVRNRFALSSYVRLERMPSSRRSAGGAR